MSQPIITKAVIPVAGFGTRFLPATKAQPKEMLPIIDKPVIQFIVEELVASGIKEIVLVTSGNKRAIEDHFDSSFELETRLKNDGKTTFLREVRRISNLAKFVYVRQKEQLGNGHALLQAKEVIGNEPFAFCYGDDVFDAEVPVTKQLIDTFRKYKKTVVGVTEVSEDVVSRYGVIRPQKLSSNTYRILGLVEKPDPKKAPSRLISPGRFIFTPAIFTALEKIRPGKGGEIWVMDAVEYLRKREPIYARRMDGAYFDCGNKMQFLKAQVLYGLKHPEVKHEFQQFLRELPTNV